MAGKPKEPAEAPREGGIELWKFAAPVDVQDVGFDRSFVVGSQCGTGGQIRGMVESIVAFPEGVLVTVAIGVESLPQSKSAARRRLLFAAGGYGVVEAP